MSLWGSSVGAAPWGSSVGAAPWGAGSSVEAATWGQLQGGSSVFQSLGDLHRGWGCSPPLPDSDSEMKILSYLHAGVLKGNAISEMLTSNEMIAPVSHCN